MPDGRLVLCCSALEDGAVPDCLRLLAGFPSQGNEKSMFVWGKVASSPGVRTTNVDAGHPAELARLEALPAWVGRGAGEEGISRDGVDVYCLKQLVSSGVSADHVVLVRWADGFEALWPRIKEDGLRSCVQLVPAFVGPGALSSKVDHNLVIDPRDQRSASVLDAMLELYLSGAVYGMVPYSLRQALELAMDVADRLSSAPLAPSGAGAAA